jgi:hypothetical protein
MTQRSCPKYSVKSLLYFGSLWSGFFVGSPPSHKEHKGSQRASNKNCHDYTYSF